jgi:hypothetical protein
MQNAMWLASVFGPLLVILGVWMLFYRDNMLKVWTAIKGNPGILYVLGVADLFVGLIIINAYNVWSKDVMVLVTLLGWVLFLKGIVSLFFPQLILKQKARSDKLSIRGLIALVWGAVLCWYAFWM